MFTPAYVFYGTRSIVACTCTYYYVLLYYIVKYVIQNHLNYNCTTFPNVIVSYMLVHTFPRSTLLML